MNIGLFVVQDCMVLFGGQTNLTGDEQDTCYLFFGKDPEDPKTELTLWNVKLNMGDTFGDGSFYVD